MTDFLILDVFTEVPLTGNPLAVIPDARDLPEVRLQKIAREFNFSETTFVFPPSDPENSARVRIFTPATEIPFAGHPLIGTAVALAADGRPAELRFEIGIGVLPVAVRGQNAAFTSAAPLTFGPTVAPEIVAACLGLKAADIATTTHSPQIASVGLPYCLVELASRTALDAIVTDPRAFRLATNDFDLEQDFEIYCYWSDGDILHARMFAPLGGIPEDPATGSAAAALAAYLATEAASDRSLDLRQGAQMGRPSRLHVSATFRDGKLRDVTVEGAVRRIAEGRLTLPPDP